MTEQIDNLITTSVSTLPITNFEGKSLEELIEPLVIGAQEYLILRLRGVSNRDALKVMERSYDSIDVWRYQHPYYKAVREWLLDHAEEYKKQANDIVNSRLTIIEHGLFKLALKILDWDTLENTEKSHVLKAALTIKKIHPSSAGGGGESYDELVLRMRRER